MSQAKTTAIMNQKGGVGKTTTTINLGVGLAKAGKRVLLIDADPQASLTVALGMKNPDELDVTITDVLRAVAEDRAPPEYYGIIHHPEGVDVLPSSIELSAFEVNMIGMMSREYLLRDALAPLKENDNLTELERKIIMKQVVNPSLKELKQALGDQYQICYIDMEKCLYRDFGNGFNVEVSGVSRANKNGPATLYLWFGTTVNDCFMQSKHLSLLKRERKVPPAERKPLLMTELNEEEEKQKAQ